MKNPPCRPRRQSVRHRSWRYLTLASLVALGTISAAAQATIDQYGLGKKRDFLQTSAATPSSQAIPGDPGGPFHFSATLGGSNLTLLSSPKVTLPNATSLALVGDASSLDLDRGFASQAALDTAFPNGTYNFSAGSAAFTLSLGSTNLYSAEIPMVTNGTWDEQGRLRITNPNGAILNFNTFSSYLSAPGAIVSFEIYSTTGGVPDALVASIDRTNLTGFSTEPILTSAATGPLQPERLYYAELSFVRIATLNTNSLPAVGVAAFASTTGFMIWASAPDAPPSFSAQPIGQTFVLGGTLSLSVGVTGYPTPALQWQRNGVNISGATSATLVIPNVQLADAGTYQVVATNSTGTVFSNPATVLVIAPSDAPTIIVQPTSQSAAVGATVTLSVVIGGSGGGVLSYRWQKDGVNLSDNAQISGTLTPALTLRNVQLGDSGSYSVVVSNGGKSVLSTSAILTVGGSPGVVAASAGNASSFFIRGDGSLWGCGNNSSGQLGDGTTTDRLRPILVAQGVAQIAASENHTLFVKTDGTLWATGAIDFGQPAVLRPILIAQDVVAAGAGPTQSVFLKSDGTLWGWGGAVALGFGHPFQTFSSAPVFFVHGVVALSVGGGFTLFQKHDRSLWGTGSNLFGQLGTGQEEVGLSAPVQIAPEVVAFSAGYSFSIFVRPDHSAWAMGDNGVNQFGDNTFQNHSLPVQVRTDTVRVYAGKTHVLFLDLDNTLWMAGSEAVSSLAPPSGMSRAFFGDFTTLFATAAAGFTHSLYLKPNGELWGRAYNDRGQLADGTTTYRSFAIQIAGGRTIAPATAPKPSVVEEDLAPRALRLNWSFVTGAVEYEVWRGTTDVPSQAQRIATVSNPLYYDLGAIPGTRYFYWVKAVNSGGASAFSASTSAIRTADAADFNADGKPDLIWSNSITGERALWLMNGTNFLGASTLGLFPLEWTIAATGDFNADGKPDLVWSNSQTGERALWLMNGTNLLAVSTLGIFPPEWTVAATADFNADGKPDLIWSNSVTGERAIWLMNGTNFLGASTLGIFPLEWTVAATGDFNADGKPDLIWSNSLTGERALWLMDGTTRIGVSTLGLFPLEWTVAGTADFNADGKPDIIWSNSVTGERALWLMNGTQFLGASTLGIFPLEWTVKN